MNNNQKLINILSVVSTPYTTFDGNISTMKDGNIQSGLFVILHLNDDKRTAIAAKLSSNMFIQSASVVFIPQVDCPFLRTNSLLYIDKLHTLALDKCTFIGNITNTEIYNNIYTHVRNLGYTLVHDLKTVSITNDTKYKSPNKFIQGGNNENTNMC